MTANRELCIGEQLIFRCRITVGSYDWIVLPFLDGTNGNGRILVGESRTDGHITLSASGVGAARMSTLQVTLFEGLVGERNISCAETGNRGNSEIVTITVLGE